MVRRWFRKNGLDPSESEDTELDYSIDADQSTRPQRWFQKKTLSTENEDDDEDRQTHSGRSHTKNSHNTNQSNRSLFSYWGRNNVDPADDIQPTPTVATNSVVEALYSLMGDEDLSDVRIHGNDGGSVVAVKAILASRSPVFRQTFFGAHPVPPIPAAAAAGMGGDGTAVEEDPVHSDANPNDAGSLETAIVLRGAPGTVDTDDSSSSSDDDDDEHKHQPTKDETHPTKVRQTKKTVVKFEEWDCRILYLLVEFCYTDNLSIMDVRPSDEIARIMAGLRAASKAFKLRGLFDKVDQWGFRNISRYPALCCALIDEGMRRDDIDALAMKTLQLKTRAALLPVTEGVGSGILALSKPGLLFVLRHLEDKASHMLLFDALQRWVEFSSDGGYLNLDPARERASKTAFASRCATRFIKLGKISPGRMEEVMNSGLLLGREKSFVPPSTPSLTT
eukprot:CAMPEP_0198277704 /NCGR_PEP_ID=MMETSP1447-20131203/65991_1 /TAXON_ID=420782 /ORGANISM="Chaetoceros dichaeta, Strain CCMP1751" /LENGTH=448 /DNA_ID=CAMNT_0043972745 /DNA_START=122 /DNA_END=1468 /DNA_ORIENTATION=-